jgi:hypothetical protein
MTGTAPKSPANSRQIYKFARNSVCFPYFAHEMHRIFNKTGIRGWRG